MINNPNLERDIDELKRWDFFKNNSLSITGYRFILAIKNPIIHTPDDIEGMLCQIESLIYRGDVNKKEIAFHFRSQSDSSYILNQIIIQGIDPKINLYGFNNLDKKWYVDLFDVITGFGPTKMLVLNYYT